MGIPQRLTPLRSIDLQAIVEEPHLFQCPACQAPFSRVTEAEAACEAGHAYAADRGLPLLFAPHEEYASSADVTGAMSAFYSQNPFPDYEDLDSVGSLMERSARSGFARALDQHAPSGIRVLEVGCGTGQMSLYLSLASRQVFGVDLCANSLQLARDFRDRHGLDRARFYQMNVFRPIFREESFDLVYCSGVLHHTRFPARGFREISRLVKRGRYLIVGLYNRYLRIPTHLRRLLSRFARIDNLDPVMRRLSTAKKRRTWFLDQYRNPHESNHSLSEVAGWLEAEGFSFVSSIPAARLGRNGDALANPFRELGRGSRLEMLLSQLLSIPVFGREGGLFLVVGQRHPQPAHA